MGRVERADRGGGEALTKSLCGKNSWGNLGLDWVECSVCPKLVPSSASRYAFSVIFLASFSLFLSSADGGSVWLETESVPFMTEGKEELNDDVRTEFGRFG